MGCHDFYQLITFINYQLITFIKKWKYLKNKQNLFKNFRDNNDIYAYLFGHQKILNWVKKIKLGPEDFEEFIIVMNFEYCSSFNRINRDFSDRICCYLEKLDQMDRIFFIRFEFELTINQLSNSTFIFDFYARRVNINFEFLNYSKKNFRPLKLAEWSSSWLPAHRACCSSMHF